MKYKYKISQEEIETNFNNLLEIDFEDTNAENKTLYRNKVGSGVYNVYIKTFTHVLLLLDYLSYDESQWDYHPKLCIHVNNNTINFQRRGNTGHINSLENGDMLIINDFIRDEIILNDIPKGDINLRKGYYELLNANKNSENTINMLRKKIASLTNEINSLK